MSQKTGHSTFAHNFAKYWQIFKILSQSDSAVNIWWNNHWRSNHTSKVSLHDLVKINVRKQATIWNIISRSAINLNLKLHTFWLTCVTMNIQKVLWLECRTFAARVIYCQSQSITLCSTHMLPQIINIHILHCWLVDSLPRLYNQLDSGHGCSAATNLEVHMRDSLLGYCTFGLLAANDAQNVRLAAVYGKDHRRQSLSEMITWYRNVYIFKLLQISEDTNNSVYKLTTDNLQLVLTNLLIRWMFEYKVV